MISHCSIERIPDGNLCRMPNDVFYLSRDWEWESILLAPGNERYDPAPGVCWDPLFPNCFDLHPTIDDFTRSKILEIDKLPEQVSLIFRYRGNWYYGVGYSKEVLGQPMTLSEFYAEVARIVSQL